MFNSVLSVYTTIHIFIIATICETKKEALKRTSFFMFSN